MSEHNEGTTQKHRKRPNELRDQSETEGRIGEGKNAGVRNLAGGAGTQRSEESDRKRTDSTRDPDVRVGAKGVMHLDIGESICLQPGNDCSVDGAREG